MGSNDAELSRNHDHRVRPRRRIVSFMLTAAVGANVGMSESIVVFHRSTVTVTNEITGSTKEFIFLCNLPNLRNFAIPNASF